MFESRILGPIDLNGGIGGGAMDSATTIAGTKVPVRLEIDHPGELKQSLIDDLDVVLEHPEIIDRIAREAIAAQLSRGGTAPAELREASQRAQGGRSLDDDEFLRALRPMKLTITPDGGTANLDRVVVAYGLSDSPVTGQITVRLPSVPTGPEIDPAPRNGY